MKRIIIFLAMVWAHISMTHAQEFVVYSAPKTVTVAKGKEDIPLKQGQKLDIGTALHAATNATLDLINVKEQKRYVLNIKRGHYTLEKLVKKSNAIEMSKSYIVYVMKELLKQTSVLSGDGDNIGGAYRDDEDMFDIQEWLDNDSIGYADTLNINQNFAVPPLGKDSIGSASTPDADAKQ